MSESKSLYENMPLERKDFHEKPKEVPKISIFLIRHGESEKDKTKPNRGLTEKGVEQVNETFDRLIDSLVREQNPDFTQAYDPQTKKEMIQKTLADVEFRIYDSGTVRTLEQLWFEYNRLRELGVPEENIYLPKSALEYKNVSTGQKSGPGITKRLEGVRGLDKNPSFRKKLQDTNFQKSVGAKGDLMAWALMPEDEIPQDVEKRSEMIQRYKENIDSADKAMSRMAQNLSKRTVIIANSHSSIITLAASSELGIPIEKLDEVPEAQGIRYDYYSGKNEHTVKPLGKEMEKRVGNIGKK